MQNILLLATELMSFVIVCVAINATVLALRNPHRTGWLRTVFATDVLTALCLLAAFASLSFLGLGIFTHAPNLIGGLPLFAATVVVIYMGVERIMQVNQRLAACEAGRSPLKPLVVEPNVPAS